MWRAWAQSLQFCFFCSQGEEIAINLTKTGDFQSVFLSEDGYFMATKESHCDTDQMTDLVPITGDV